MHGIGLPMRPWLMLPLKMLMEQLYTDEVWNQYVEKVESKFKLKTYPQLDPFFDFRSRKEEIRSLVSDPTLRKIAEHSFLPFVKVLQKTPRYRYQEDEDDFGLETKIRPILFASHFDTYIYGFYAYALSQVYQDYIRIEGFDSCVLAYRNDLEGQCNIQFAKEAFDQVKSKIEESGECSVIAMDIKSYFDNIDHEILKQMWCKVIGEDQLPDDQYKVYRSLAKYSYIKYDSFLKHFGLNIKRLKKKGHKAHGRRHSTNTLLDLIPIDKAGLSLREKLTLLRKRKLITVNRDKVHTFSKKGIPQGSAMSSVLSNVYLLEFDRKIYEKGKREGFVYRRYCDDLLIICRPEKVNELKDFLMDLILREYKLILQDKKTEVLDFKFSKGGKIRSFKRAYDESTKEFLPLPNDNENFKDLQYLGFEFNGQNIYVRTSSLSRYFRKLKARIVKTVSMAYSKNSKSDTIFKQQLYSRYSHFGNRNFLTYVHKASKKYYFNKDGKRKEGMDSPSIRRQVAAHMGIIKKEIAKTSAQRAKQKRSAIIKS